MLIAALIFIVILTFATIGSQIWHVYYVIHQNSLLSNKNKKFQAGLFCGIISLAILYFALTGQHWYALAGAIIEMIFNVDYYTNRSQINIPPKLISDARKDNKSEWWAKFWYVLEKDRMKYFLSILFPIMIFIFSLQIDWILNLMGTDFTLK